MPSWDTGEKKEIRGILGRKVFVGVTDGVQDRTPVYGDGSFFYLNSLSFLSFLRKQESRLVLVEAGNQ